MLVARTPYTVSELNLAIDWFSGVCAMLFETSTRSTNQLLVLLNLIFGWTNQRLILVLCKFHLPSLALIVSVANGSGYCIYYIVLSRVLGEGT